MTPERIAELRGYWKFHGRNAPITKTMIFECLDEIERLKAENETLKTRVDGFISRDWPGFTKPPSLKVAHCKGCGCEIHHAESWCGECLCEEDGGY